MKVKIGNKIYDAEKEPIMIIFDEVDKQNVINMAPEATKLICYPDAMDPTAVLEWSKHLKTSNRYTKNMQLW